MKLRQFVGAVIRDARWELDFTQEELASRSGLHRTYITDVETGKRNISIESLEKIAAALNTPLSTLFQKLEEKQTQPLHLVHRVPLNKTPVTRQIEILLVDDDISFIELTLHSFREANLKNVVHVARDGAEALEFIFATGDYENRKPPLTSLLIFLDLKLPKISGIEVLSKIRSSESTKDIPVIITTSSQSTSDFIKINELGIKYYLTKPINFSELTNIVSSYGLQWLLLEKHKASNF